MDFVQKLAKAKARRSPRLLRKSAQIAWASRWLGLLAVAAHRAFATSLLDLPVDDFGCDGEEPWLEEVLHEARLTVPPAPSRMPAHGNA